MEKYCFGVDLGGTTVKIGLFDTEGTVLEKWEIPTRKENYGGEILPDIAEAIQDKMKERTIVKEEVLKHTDAVEDVRLIEEVSDELYEFAKALLQHKIEI